MIKYILCFTLLFMSCGIDVASPPTPVITIVNGKLDPRMVELINGNVVILPSVQFDVTTSIIVVTDQKGNIIEGSISTDGEHLIFTPKTPLISGEVYDISLTIGLVNYFVTVILPVDKNKFYGVKFYSDSVDTSIKDIIGWDFTKSTRFYMNMVGLEQTNTVLLTLYGKYDIPGHENEIYYQRWSAGGVEVKDYNWGVTAEGKTSTLSVDDVDYSISKGDGTYYNFTLTYIEVEVLDRNNDDISKETSAYIHIVKY